MIKAIQVLSEGKHFGKLFFISKDGGTNVLDQDDTISSEELDTLVTRIIPVTEQAGFHLNVNVLSPEDLIKLHIIYVKQEAGIELTPEEQALVDSSSQLTIRVSGFAVRFLSLTSDQRKDVISRTFTTKF